MTVTHHRLSSSLLAVASLCALGVAGCAAKYNNAVGITAQPVQILWNTTGPAQVAPPPTAPTAADPNPPLVQPAPQSPIGVMFNTTPLGPNQLNATASTSGTFAYTPAAGSFLAAGTQTLSVTFTPIDTTHYMTTTRTVQIQVNDIAAASSATALAPQAVQIIGGGYVDGVFFHPLQKDLRYVRTDVGGAYRWDQVAYTGKAPQQSAPPAGNLFEKLQYGNWTPLLDFVGRPDAGDQGVESLGLDPSDAKRLYLSTGLNYNNDPAQQNHIYLSDDQGNTFTKVNAPFPINGNDNGRSAGERFGVDPNLGTTIYYGTRTAGLWKSLDRGLTWSQVASFPVKGPTHGAGVVFVSFFAASGTAGTATPVIYVGVSDYNYYNADGSNNGTPTYMPIYRSVDAGATWQMVPGQKTTVANPTSGALPANYNLTPIHSAVGPDGVSTQGSFYVTYFSDQGPGSTLGAGAGAVYKYTPDEGSPSGDGTWTDITPNSARNGSDEGGYGGLALDAEKPGVIMVTTQDDYNNGGDDIYRSLDYGKDWASLKHGLSDINDVANSPWLPFGGDGSTLSTGTGNWPSSIAIDPFNSNHVAYGTGQTLWDSTNVESADLGQPLPPIFEPGAYGAALGGTKQVQGGASIEETVVLSLASPPAGVPLLSAVGDLGTFVHVSLDASPKVGSDSTPIFTTGTSVDFAQNQSLTVIRVGTGTLHGAQYDTNAPYTPQATAPPGTTCDATSNSSHTNCVQIQIPQLLAISTVDGVSANNNEWTGVDTLYDAANLAAVTSTTKQSVGGGTVAISPDASSFVWATYDFPPACTADNGKTWTPAVNGIIGAQVVSDRITPGVYYQYDGVSGQLLMGTATITTGSTSSFQCNLTFATQSTLPANSSGQLASSFAVAGDLWLAVNGSSNASANGLYHSADFGKTLTQISGFTEGYAIGLGAPATGNDVAAYSKPAVYAAATGASGYGFYRSIDNGANWVLVSTPQHLLGTVNVIIGDQRMFGRYYIGTGGRGIGYADSQ